MQELNKLSIYFLGLCFTLIAFAQENAPGSMVDVGGYHLHFNVKGSGEKTIVIEAGTGSWSLQWMKFQNDLAKDFKVITYDRAGYGWSETSPYARTAKNIVDELHTGLRKIGLEGKYILLGHSYGGMLMKAYAKYYPDEVEAIIFADAATENQFSKLPPMVNEVLKGTKSQFRQTGEMARNGMVSPEMMPVDSTLNEAYWEDYRLTLSRASFYDAMVNEMDLLPMTYENASYSQPLNIPVLILTAENSFGVFSQVPGMPVEESNEIWLKLQDQLKSSSSNVKHKILERATHDLLLSAHAVFIQEVKDFLEDI